GNRRRARGTSRVPRTSPDHAARGGGRCPPLSLPASAGAGQAPGALPVVHLAFCGRGAARAVFLAVRRGSRVVFASFARAGRAAFRPLTAPPGAILGAGGVALARTLSLWKNRARSCRFFAVRRPSRPFASRSSFAQFGRSRPR